jgi:pimeloyl-ACP methyl ester carboxylesterase
VTIVPYVYNKGIRIHYEVEGDGTPLVLLHGLADTYEMWHVSGYVESLKKEYRLILIDARGHGDSDKPHDSEAYAIKLMVNDVVAVLDDLKISKAHFLGYSGGGRQGFGIAKYSPQRFHSLIIGGIHPYAISKEYMIKLLDAAKRATHALASDSLDASAKEALLKQLLGPTAAKMPEWRAYAQNVLPANDWEALIALVSKDWGNSFDDVLPTMTMPVLLFDGEADLFYSSAKECAKSIPNATFISFPELDHAGVIARKDLVLPHIAKFLEKVSQNS